MGVIMPKRVMPVKAMVYNDPLNTRMPSRKQIPEPVSQPLAALALPVPTARAPSKAPATRIHCVIVYVLQVFVDNQPHPK